MKKAVVKKAAAKKALERLLEAPTYARARLKLGISGVGLFVVLSLIAASAGIPQSAFGQAGGGLFTDASLIAIWLVCVGLVSLPFELLGGYILPQRFGRQHPELGDWFVGWLRGVLVVALTMSQSGALIILAGRYGGRVGAMGMLIMLMVLLAGFQGLYARLVGGLRRVRPAMDELNEELRRMGVVPPTMIVLESEDEGFTGGVAGLPTAEQVVIPMRWVGMLEPKTLALLIARRIAILDQGLRAVGLAGAMLWTAFSFGLATILPGAGVDTVAGFLTTSLWFTVMSFLGLLFLPTPSRAASIAGDAFLIAGGFEERRDELIEALGTLDKLSDDEPERPEDVERIFHPVPSLGSRTRALMDPKPERAPWHLARTSLFLSIAALNPLHRLVHCNAGRPDLWIFLPSDG